MSDETILHQDDVEEVIDAEVEAVLETDIEALSTHAAIANLAAPSATYVEAEALASRNAVNGILAVLRDIGAIPV